MTIRVVLAEDNVLLRDGVSRLVEAQDGLELAGVCGDLPSLLALVESAKPDVVVTDIRMPPVGHRRGHPRRRRAAHGPSRASAWSCSASTPARRTPSTCCPRGPRAAPTS